MNKKNDDDFASGCVVWFLFIIFLMPIVGLYIIYKGDEDKKILGWILFIVGCILWLWFESGKK